MSSNPTSHPDSYDQALAAERARESHADALRVRRGMPGWAKGLLGLLLVACVALGAALWYVAKDKSDVKVESKTTKVIESVKREEQVVLLSLGIQGLTEQNSQGQLFGHNIPLTNRTKLLQYSYKAKLGIEGKDVSVTELGEHHYQVNIPAFMFIGHSDEDFKTAVEDNGVLSWVTPDIDAAQAMTDILSDDAKQKNVDDNRSQLEDQAKIFYSSIIKAVDPEAQIEFAFK